MSPESFSISWFDERNMGNETPEVTSRKTKDEVISIRAGIQELTIFIFTLRINRLSHRHEDAIHYIYCVCYDYNGRSYQNRSRLTQGNLWRISFWIVHHLGFQSWQNVLSNQRRARSFTETYETSVWNFLNAVDRAACQIRPVISHVVTHPNTPNIWKAGVEKQI